MTLLGLGKLAVNIVDNKQSKPKTKKGSKQDEAQDILKKVQTKSESGDCPFC